MKKPRHENPMDRAWRLAREAWVRARLSETPEERLQRARKFAQDVEDDIMREGLRLLEAGEWR